MVAKETNNKLIVGGDEWCIFPQLGIPAVKARVDSGAKTSSLHAFNIRAFKRSGQPWVAFDIHPIQQNRKISVHCESPVVDRRVMLNIGEQMLRGAAEKLLEDEVNRRLQRLFGNP